MSSYACLLPERIEQPGLVVHVMFLLESVAFAVATFRQNKDLRDDREGYPTCRRDKKLDMACCLIVVRPLGRWSCGKL